MVDRRYATWLRAAATLAVGLLVSGAVAHAQTLTKVRDIRANPRGYANEVVTIEGFATQWVESTATTTSFYFLKDDWGGVIKLRTSREKPMVGTRYRVTGPVGIDVAQHNDVFISEEMRIEVRDESAPQAPAVAAPIVVPTEMPEPAPGGLSKESVILIVAIVAAVALLIGLVAWLARSRRQAPPTGLGDDLGSGLPSAVPEAPPQIVEGRTIKIFAPPPGTLKILPGRFEVVAGDDTVKEIRFYRVKGQSTPEVTFGRAAGAPFTHVQLKPMTVSSRQAKLTFINNQWILTNFASEASNPTRVNGMELPAEGQAALKEGDRIEMGEVTFLFHAS